MSYKVRIGIFEGPFDLLVYLIERAGLSIYDVNISEITSQYIEYVDSIKIIDPETAAEFMVLAATLLQIKSKMLLPAVRIKEDASESDDPIDELALKIEEYKKVKYLSSCMRRCEEEGARVFTKPREDISSYVPVEELKLDLDQFIDAFKLFLEKRRRIEEVKRRYQRIDRERMSMEAKAHHMRHRIMQAGEIDFACLLKDTNDTYDVVLTFVTMLEMLKAGMIEVSQDTLFGNIKITAASDEITKEQAG